MSGKILRAMREAAGELLDEAGDVAKRAWEWTGEWLDGLLGKWWFWLALAVLFAVVAVVLPIRILDGAVKDVVFSVEAETEVLEVLVISDTSPATTGPNRWFLETGTRVLTDPRTPRDTIPRPFRGFVEIRDSVRIEFRRKATGDLVVGLEPLKPRKSVSCESQNSSSDSSSSKPSPGTALARFSFERERGSEDSAGKAVADYWARCPDAYEIVVLSLDPDGAGTHTFTFNGQATVGADIPDAIRGFPPALLSGTVQMVGRSSSRTGRFMIDKTALAPGDKVTVLPASRCKTPDGKEDGDRVVGSGMVRVDSGSGGFDNRGFTVVYNATGGCAGVDRYGAARYYIQPSQLLWLLKHPSLGILGVVCAALVAAVLQAFVGESVRLFNRPPTREVMDQRWIRLGFALTATSVALVVAGVWVPDPVILDLPQAWIKPVRGLAIIGALSTLSLAIRSFSNARKGGSRRARHRRREEASAARHR